MAVIAEKLRNLYGITEKESENILEEIGIYKDVTVNDIKLGMYPQRLEPYFEDNDIPLRKLNELLQEKDIEELLTTNNTINFETIIDETPLTLGKLSHMFNPLFFSEERMIAYCTNIFGVNINDSIALNKNISYIYKAINSAFDDIDSNSHLHLILRSPVNNEQSVNLGTHLAVQGENIFFEIAGIATLVEILEAGCYTTNITIVNLKQNGKRDVSSWYRKRNKYLPLDKQAFLESNISDVVDNIQLTNENIIYHTGSIVELIPID